MEAEIDSKFSFEHADQPNHVCHRIYLLQNLRQMKNSIARRNLQKTKSQIVHEAVNGICPNLESGEEEIGNRITKIANEIPVALDSLTSNRKKETLSKPSLLSSENGESSSATGITLLSIIELLGTLYDPSRDNVFFQQQERLVHILNTIKKNELSDNELLHLRTEYQTISQEKEKFTRILPT